jgi:branched-subunit amino acid transport protein
VIPMDLGLLPWIVAAALLTYATRIAGLSLGGRAVPPVVVRFLTYVPIAAFAALATPGLGGTDDDLIPRLAAAAVTVFVMVRTRQLWACLIVGMAVFWITRTVS